MVVRRTIGIFAAVFLLLNLAMRFNALHNHSSLFSVLLLVGAVIALTVRFRPGFLKLLCLFLGLSLPLYGFQSYTLYNCIFEFSISYLGCLLLFERNLDQRSLENAGRVVSLLGGFIVLALLSLLLLPISSIMGTLSLWGVFDFSNAVFWATPENPLYSIAAGNRLVLFGIVVFLLAKNPAAVVLYRRLFTGCALSVVAVCLLGLLHHFEIISLAWYRPNFLTGSEVGRLHSVFGNPGWFAEYVIVCTPFVLLLLGRITGLSTRLLVLSATLALVGASLLLTGSRMSWLAFACVVPFCYLTVLLFYHGKDDQRITWPEISRSCRKIGLGVLVAGLIGGSVFLVVAQSRSVNNNDKYISQTGYILHRIYNIADSKELRFKIWQEALALVSENPLYGMGYEGYRRHQEMMGTIPESRFARQRQTGGNWDDAHNLYVQLVVNNGGIGLLVWLTLVGYVALLLYRDGVTNRNQQSFILLGSLGAFHLYGFAQSMIYVASNWFLFFLIIGYAMLVDQKRLVRNGKYAVVVLFVAVMIGGIAYGDNLQSRRLAERYGLLRYDKEREVERYSGFYQREDWGKDGYFRWSGRNAEIVLSGSGAVKFDFICHAPRLDKQPVIMDVMLNGLAIDRYTFSDGQKVTRTYFVPAGNDHTTNTLQLRLSRTWVPTYEKMGNDTRVLGVAVSEPRYM
jgi:O-antigen ligase